MSLAVSLRSKNVKLCEWNYDFYFVIFRRVFWKILESREKSSMITHVVRFYKIQVLLSKNFVISIRNSNFSRLYFGADKKELWSDESISSNAPLKSHLERERTRSREQNSNCNRDLLLFRVCECVRRKRRRAAVNAGAVSRLQRRF